MPLINASERRHFIQNTVILFAVGTTAAISRICIRFYLTRRLGIEEIIMFVSLLCWAGDTGLIVVFMENGTNQVFGGDAARLALSPDEISRREIGSKAFISAWYLYINAIWGCKTAILLFYKRVTDRVRQRRTILIAGIVLFLSYMFCMLGISLVCRPYKGLWQVYPDPGPACTEGLHFVWIVGITNILTDLMLITIPMPVVYHLQVDMTKKILLGCMFSLGIFVIIATTLRIYFTVVGGSVTNMAFWSEIETSTLFVVSNAPGIRTIFIYWKKKNATGSSQSYKMGGLPASAGNKHIPTITTIMGPRGDSQERIIDEEEDRMVIHQNITYEVVVERSTPTESEKAANSEENYLS